MFTIILLIPFTLSFSILTLILLRQLAYKINSLETNFRGNKIPVGSGVIIPILFICLYPFVVRLGHENEWRYFCFIMSSLGIIGFIDDRFGSKEIKGIRGHITNFYKKKRISTGLAKLILITIVGLNISAVLYDELLTIFVCTITFAIWTNIINLLDVRPGRAIKGFWVLTIVLFSVHFLNITYLVWVIVIQSILLIIIDIYEWGMLGDSGSNILGGMIGFWMIAYSSNIEVYVYLAIGSVLTIYAEKKSFSQWIEKHPMIQRIDHWGRKVID